MEAIIFNGAIVVGFISVCLGIFCLLNKEY